MCIRDSYYTEYCDGKSVTCPGMKQWGTVDRAKEGKSALEILRYYYGSRVQLVTTNNIASIPQSYPGSPLRRGSTGTCLLYTSCRNSGGGIFLHFFVGKG